VALEGTWAGQGRAGPGRASDAAAVTDRGGLLLLLLDRRVRSTLILVGLVFVAAWRYCVEYNTAASTDTVAAFGALVFCIALPTCK